MEARIKRINQEIQLNTAYNMYIETLAENIVYCVCIRHCNHPCDRPIRHKELETLLNTYENDFKGLFKALKNYAQDKGE